MLQYCDRIISRKEVKGCYVILNNTNNFYNLVKVDVIEIVAEYHTSHSWDLTEYYLTDEYREKYNFNSPLDKIYFNEREAKNDLNKKLLYLIDIAKQELNSHMSFFKKTH